MGPHTPEPTLNIFCPDGIDTAIFARIRGWLMRHGMQLPADMPADVHAAFAAAEAAYVVGGGDGGGGGGSGGGAGASSVPARVGGALRRDGGGGDAVLRNWHLSAEATLLRAIARYIVERDR